MSLKRKFLAQNLLLALGLGLAAVASFWRLNALRHEAAVSRYAYTELKTAQTTMLHIARAQGILSSPGGDRRAGLDNLRQAVSGLDDFTSDDQNYSHDPAAAAAYGPLIETAHRARGRLASVVSALEHAPGGPVEPSAAAAMAELDRAFWDLESLVRGCTAYIRGRQEAAADRLDVATLLVASLGAAALVAALLVTFSQYRSVVLPLQRLRRGVRSVAAAHFAERVEPAGPRELAELAKEFNRMAAELDGFYRQLEEKVAAKSRELVRSERLASVGFLAAGVAHEINNPLNVISGYAELTLKRLRALDGDAVADDAAKSLRIIRDEAFRCKETTEKLLSLARGGGDAREPLSLADVAREVALMTRGIRHLRDRDVKLDFENPESLCVVANAGEMKQVLLNLTINALQAVAPNTGQVRVEGRRREAWVEVSVSDNGRGIPPEALGHVFEPFFTDKRGASEPGTGLGLSIVHAIVESHGGRITAESEGVGRGSRFTFRLPAAGRDHGGVPSLPAPVDPAATPTQEARA